MNARKVFPSRVEDEWIGKTFLAWMTMTRQGKHHTVRSDLTGLTLLIITTKQSVTFYGKMYGKVQYRTPIPSHVPVKVNTVTCAGKGFVTPNKHDELPHSFYSTTDNNNYQQWENTVRRICEYCVFHITNAEKVFQITSRRRVIWKAFFGMSDVENSIITFPTSQYSHCWKIQPGN